MATFQTQNGGDEVDGGLFNFRPGGSKTRRMKHISDNDSAYNTEDELEGHYSDSSLRIVSPPPKTTKKSIFKLKSKSKSKHHEDNSAVLQLVTNFNKILSYEDCGDFPTPTNDGAKFVYSSSEEEEIVFLNGIDPWTVKLRAETSRHNDCQMRLDSSDQISGLPHTTKPVFGIKFDAFDDEKQNTKHLWKNNTDKLGDTYPDANFLLPSPLPSREELPPEPSPEDQDESEPVSPSEEPVSEGEAPLGAHAKLSEVDGATACGNDGSIYEYRLARVVTDNRIVAIHEDDVESKNPDGTYVFNIQWKVVMDSETKTFTLNDPSHGSKMIMAVTYKGVCMRRVNEHANFLQNPNANIAIWAVSP